jgi:molybdopterin-guanine dinucleotide biosynthesis protein A
VTGDGKSSRVAGYVLAGGASSRFGFDKARAEIGGETMLARTCRLVQKVTGSATVVAPAGRYSDSDVTILAEAWPGKGPLGGILSALMEAQQGNHTHGWCLIVSCDMPFLTSDWLTYLVERARECDASVVVPRSTHGLEPLCACWHTRGTSKLQHAFEGGVRKITEAMKHQDMEILDETHWKRFDSAGRVFWNVNTPADYDQAKRILEAEQRERFG